MAVPAGSDNESMIAVNLRFAVRLMARNPLFAFIGILTLAVGIGANTAIFSAMDALLVHPPQPVVSDLSTLSYAQRLISRGLRSAFSVCASTNLFRMLGVRPLLGRTFLPEEAQARRRRTSALITGALRRRCEHRSPGGLARRLRHCRPHNELQQQTAWLARARSGGIFLL